MPDDPEILFAEAVARFSHVYAEQTHLQRLALRLHALSLALLGVALLGLGSLLWYSQHEHAVLVEAVRATNQTLAVQTEALQRVLEQSHGH